ncbi:hypothetical protein SUGI_0991290 [Cryptomeria japonica]|uniref:uncharacterized protein LOC131033321 n=1 Tax=Cryptomeria japonica TaxID=3369 RepID=UPI002414AF44|nr:uncharacterized protein LOC131033321 [Cryptomeria japonica]GLJ46968.1 hypothetical protein SUGI_0991290 [Cryptomeria japonica]
MTGCLGFNLLKFLSKRSRAHWISQGFISKKIELSNSDADGKKNSIMHCLLKSPPEKPAVLLIHGFGVDGLTAWEKQIGALSKHFSLYIPDLLFFGESTTRRSERSEIFQAECVKNMLDCLQVKSVMVVGHSYGGFVGFWMAHRFPELVRCLVIVSSGVCMTPSSNDDLLKEFGGSDIKEVLIPESVPALKKALSLVLYSRPWLPNFVYRDWLENIEMNKEQKAELVDGLVIGSNNAPHPLPPLNQNVLIVWGEYDRIFKLEQAYLLERHIGDKAKLMVIKMCGHVPPLEKSAELNKALLHFLLDGNPM